MDTHSHVADAPERSHPLLWTAGLLAIIAILVAWFAHFYGVGAAVGREEDMIPSTTREQKGPGEPDHLALIANQGPEVLDRGAIVYGKNCATCHGPQGNTNPSNMNPPPRNFWSDTFKNPNGGGTYGLFTVVSNGFNGRMPGFPSLSPEDRYAVVHFLRQTMVKPHNQAGYVEQDAKEVIAKIPPKGSGAGDVKPPVHLAPVPKELFQLMHGIASETATEAEAAKSWLARAIDGSEGAVGDALLALSRAWSGDLAAGTRARGTQNLVALARAIAAGKVDAARELLLTPAPGTFVPEIGLLSRGDLDVLIAQLGKVAPAASAAKPGAGVH